MSSHLEVRYFGWSGLAAVHDGGLVAFDPFGSAVRPADLEGSLSVLCATHGHPEHCGALRELLAAAEPAARARTHLLSSAPVVDHVAGPGDLAPENAHALRAGEAVSIGPLRVRTFAWRHLPLLPPGGIGPKLEYVASLLRHPVAFVRIAASGLRLPLRAPYFGFHVRFPDGLTLLNYAEGLHRLTDPGEVEEVARTLPAHLLLFAVEPEDVETIPRWVETLSPREALVYEAHRPWRELFGLPYLDLDGFARELDGRLSGTRVRSLTRPGQRVRL